MDKTAQVCRWRNVFSIHDWHRGENVLSPSDRFLSKQRRGKRLVLFLFLSYFSVPFFRFREKGAVASPTTTGLRAWGEKFSLCEVPPKHLPSWSRCAARLVNSKWIGNKWVFGYLVPCRVLSPTKKRTNIGGTYPSLSAGRGLVTTRFYLYTFMLLLVFRFFAHVALGTLLFFSLFLVAFFLSFLFFLFHHPFCLGPYSIHSV